MRRAHARTVATEMSLRGMVPGNARRGLTIDGRNRWYQAKTCQSAFALIAVIHLPRGVFA